MPDDQQDLIPYHSRGLSPGPGPYSESEAKRKKENRLNRRTKPLK